LLGRIDKGQPVRNTIALRTSAAVGVVFGALSVVAGSRVLAGTDRPDYIVLTWLVVYNVAAGLVGVVAGVGLWLLRRWAVGLARTIAVAHSAVLVVLMASWSAGPSVAADSVIAMLLRAVVWASIALVATRVAASGHASSST
jgi:hypothetical protein